MRFIPSTHQNIGVIGAALPGSSLREDLLECSRSVRGGCKLPVTLPPKLGMRSSIALVTLLREFFPLGSVSRRWSECGERGELMHWWADRLDTLAATENVVGQHGCRVHCI
jgi:hypothetical protein